VGQLTLHILLISRCSHDSTPSLLKHPLPSLKVDLPDLKRARTSQLTSKTETIEERLIAGTYQSLQALRDDFQKAHDALISETSEEGEEAAALGIREQLSNLLQVLEHYNSEPSSTSWKTNGEVPVKESVPQSKAGQFISLRSNVNGNSHVLFSGLEIREKSEKVKAETETDLVGRTLPNGFELTDFSALGGKEDSNKQERRTFDKVFATARRLKPLDLPRPAKDVVRGNTLDFIPNSSRPENLPLHKGDYKHSKLPTGSWLSYRHSQQDRMGLQHGSSGSDPKAASTGSHPQPSKSGSEDELFSASYSSFAPSSDNTYSIISEEDLSQQWWKSHGEAKRSKIIAVLDAVPDDDRQAPNSEDEFADLVANFVPDDASEDVPPIAEEKEAKVLLQEISEMIETLSSYQRNRSLDLVAHGKVQKPEKPEFDTFEMLRNQLSIVIATLPPFAVAKLNGDQLEDLNISTKLVVEVPDYPGTGQPDDYLLRRQKLALQATQSAAAGRPAATPQQARQNYSTQVNATGYNSAAKGYNASATSNAQYGIRTAQNYQTPATTRTTYAQTPTFQASAGANASYAANRPTIQQFQRPPTQNGYGNYGSTTPLQPAAQQAPVRPGIGMYGQRPSQPGYQQRAQDSAAALARSASPQKPQALVNGAGQHYTPRPYQAPVQSGQSQATAQQAYSRQGSGTPTTPIAPATTAARFDAAGSTRPGSAQSGGGNAPQAQQSATQAMAMSR
jgi:hypothetical protein